MVFAKKKKFHKNQTEIISYQAPTISMLINVKNEKMKLKGNILLEILKTILISIFTLEPTFRRKKGFLFVFMYTIEHSNVEKFRDFLRTLFFKKKIENFKN